LTQEVTKQRLALVHYTASPVTGGVESVVATHAELLAERGYDVRVVAGRGDAELVPEVDSRHPAVEEIANCLANGDPAPEAFARLRTSLVERLGRVLADRDVVIAHNVFTMPFNLPLAAALTDLEIPLIAWTHDIAWINPRYGAYWRREWPWSMLCEPQGKARYVAISRVRQHELMEVMGLGLREVPVVPNGIDAARFLGVGPRTLELSQRAGLGNADPLILVPVRLTPRKRLELAVEVAGILNREYSNLRVVISGPAGPHSADNPIYIEELKRRRAELGLDGVVTFLADFAGPDGQHPVDDHMIAELYRMADLILLPSESEGFGLPVLEAALSRAPLVCADIAVLREVSGGYDWTFPAGSGTARIADAVRLALGSRSARLRRRARRYRWPAIVDRIERLIQTGHA
jgi:mannosylglucosylglycerate synthase